VVIVLGTLAEVSFAQTFNQVSPLPETNYNRVTRTVTQAEWSLNLFGGTARQVVFSVGSEGDELTYQFATDPHWNRVVFGVWDPPNHNATYVRSFGGPGNGTGQLKIPAGLDIDWNQFLYVADYANSRIAVLKFDRSYLTWAEPLPVPGAPIDVAWKQKGGVGGTEYLYVVLRNQARILKYELAPSLGGSSAQLMSSYGTFGTTPGTGVFNDPVAICVGKEPSAVDGGATHTSDIYVVDRGFKHIVRLRESGRRGTLTWANTSPVTGSFTSCTVDNFGNVYATASDTHQLIKGSSRIW
jgi:hypothetical protein